MAKKMVLRVVGRSEGRRAGVVGARAATGGQKRLLPVSVRMMAAVEAFQAGKILRRRKLTRGSAWRGRGLAGVAVSADLGRLGVGVIARCMGKSKAPTNG